MAKTAIVTGASQGIGVALVEALLGAGFTVHAVARDEARMAERWRQAMTDGTLVPHGLDVTDRTAVERFFAETFGEADAPLDLLFNNAGTSNSLGAVWESDPAIWWSDLTTNVLGLYLMTHAALGVMRRQNHGVIVNMDGGRPKGMSAYAASKAAVVQFTKILDEELRHENSAIAVYAANPGLVKTRLTQAQADSDVAAHWNPGVREAFAKGATRRPEEVAQKLVKLLPKMGPETSGQYFDPTTPDGEFKPMPGE
ncbi:SDR family oxidoreductase [Consotaella aegiceratis]|uniref:SDR family oxidoreductase n=1 Tax=Consotaella aegiceratis TaxID=3097961 RepID=UPI002F41130E